MRSLTTSLFAPCDPPSPLLFLQELFYENRHYHSHCFRCFRCDRSLADEPFTSQEEALVCSDCFCNEFSSKCVACDKTVMPGSDRTRKRTWLTSLLADRSLSHHNKGVREFTPFRVRDVKAGVTAPMWHDDCFLALVNVSPSRGFSAPAAVTTPEQPRCRMTGNYSGPVGTVGLL